jgi:hypothetical protein
MAKDYEVLGMLIPQGGWVLTGEGYENIEFLECDPITKEQFEAGFDEFDAMKAAQDSQQVAAKQAILDRLGLTAEEAALLLS